MAFDPSTVTAAELHTLAVARDPALIANHIYWMMTDAIRESGKGLFSVEYQRLPPVTKAEYDAMVAVVQGRGFTVRPWSISDRPNGLRVYWLTLSW